MEVEKPSIDGFLVSEAAIHDNKKEEDTIMNEPFRITREDFPEYEVISVRTRDSLYSMGKHIGALYRLAKSRNLTPAGPLFTVYYEKPTDPQKVDFEMFLPVAGDPAELDKLVDYGGDPCLKLRLKGSYSRFDAAYKALGDELAAKGLEMSGPPREVYVKGPLFGFITFLPIMVTDIYYPIKVA